MYTNSYITKLTNELSKIKAEQASASFVSAELLEQERIAESKLISLYFRYNNYSKFKTDILVNAIADLIYVAEDKKMEPSIIFFSQKYKNSKLDLRYAALIIKPIDLDLEVHYGSKEEFESDIRNKDVMVLQEDIGGIDEKISLFSIDADNPKFNSHNLNLKNIHGLNLNINIGNRQYIANFIEDLMHYKMDNFLVEMADYEVFDIMNNYALHLVSRKKRNNRIVKMKKLNEMKGA